MPNTNPAFNIHDHNVDPGPETTLTTEELCRYYAVKAAGPIPNRADGADQVVAVADWILGGEPDAI